MKILVVGCGRVGAMVINSLSFEDITIDAVDVSSNALSNLKSKNVNKIHADVLENEFLEKMDLDKYDYVLALTDRDKTNLILCTKKHSSNTKTLARLNQLDSVEEMDYLRERLHIDYIIHPEYEVAKQIRNIIGKENYYAADYFGRGKIEVVGHSVDLDPEFENVPLKHIGSLSTILVVAILRGSHFFIPDGETVLRRGDYLYLMGLSRDIMNFKHSHFSMEKKEKNREVVILGGSMVTNQIASEMDRCNIKIIESDFIRAREYRQKLKNAFVVQGNPKERNFFEEEHLDKADILIAMTGNDELNIVLGLMAKHHGVPQTMIEVHSTSYPQILDSLTLTSVLHPAAICANEIIKQIRSGEGVSINLMFGGRAQVLEVRIRQNFLHIGKRLSEINLSKGIIIGGIVRKDGSAVIPRGQTKIEEGDRLVIFCRNEMRGEVARFLNPASHSGMFDFLGW